MKTAKDLLVESLRNLGADGLCCNSCGTGCGIDDLELCAGWWSGCVPARRTTVGAERALGADIDAYLDDDEVCFVPLGSANPNTARVSGEEKHE